ncbi:hypothetical protein AAV35_014035 (plasmid) [Salimicrobium jeotgali]|uniref:DUF2325 domain-containing protein n=1 Tax=Salimicrobium jeotgali TaxID=1230341 RepID=K2H4U0_9BACI|nr:DUF2325 domain-containing protein [Salimicrobium jeotgali]AKN01839.1 hypothetical protein AAV35_014035 [Salimicrobium jeotgali]EKE30890.1 hypothetical protein MJ3_11135 [Salimicrobium jeotgali]MBM7697580.1 hypothetical protein [Salimicrobium jeotgali]
MKVLLVGGTNKNSWDKKARALGIQIMQQIEQKKEREMKAFLRKNIPEADVVIICISACSHSAMWEAKKVAKECGTPIRYTPGKGASKTFHEALQAGNNKHTFLNDDV